MNLINFRRFPTRRAVPMNSLFDDFFSKGLTDFFPDNWFSANPSVNVSENDNDFVIELAAPGLERDDFSIELKDNALVIKVENEKTTEDESDNYLRREFNYSAFERHFQLPENVKAEDISAKYDNGILVLNLPKVDAKEDKAIKRIEIA